LYVEIIKTINFLKKIIKNLKRGEELKVYYSPPEEHLPYILASAVWHYMQSTEKILNTTHDSQLIGKLLHEHKIIKEKINYAVKNPILGDNFLIDCDNVELNQLLIRILNHYLEETKEILLTIENPLITEKCMNDISIIENQLIKAIRVIN